MMKSDQIQEQVLQTSGEGEARGGSTNDGTVLNGQDRGVTANDGYMCSAAATTNPRPRQRVCTYSAGAEDHSRVRFRGSNAIFRPLAAPLSGTASRTSSRPPLGGLEGLSTVARRPLNSGCCVSPWTVTSAPVHEERSLASLAAATEGGGGGAATAARAAGGGGVGAAACTVGRAEGGASGTAAVAAGGAAVGRGGGAATAAEAAASSTRLRTIRRRPCGAHCAIGSRRLTR